MQELCQKDCLLEEQRKIIVEIQIRLDEKQKMLETLRQSLEASQATAARLEAEQSSLQQQLRESEEKRSKSCKVVQNLMTKTKQLSSELREAKERNNKAEWEARQQPPDEIGEMTIEETEVREPHIPTAPNRRRIVSKKIHVTKPAFPAI